MEVDNATRPLRPSGVPGRWTASSELRRGDSYTAEVYDPEPTAGELRQADRTGFRVARSRPARDHRAVPAGAPADGPVGRRRHRRADRRRRSSTSGRSATTTSATSPTRRCDARATTRSTRTFRRSPYARTWELAKQLRAAAETPFEYILLVNNYLHGGEFGYSERPQQPPAGRAPLDAFLIDTKEGYCQHFSGAMALLLRMGGDPGARGDRLQPRRVLEAPRRLDRARHRRPRLGRGVVRRARLGHLRPDARLDPRALADRRAGGGAGRRSPPRRPRPTRRPAAASARSSRAVLRPNLLFDPLRNSPGTPPDEQGTGRAWWVVGADRRRRRFRRPRRSFAGSASAVAAASCRRSTARSPSSRPRCAAPAGRCRPARRCASSSSASGRHRRRPRTCAR